MDSRNRVLCACERRKADRPPTSLRFTADALERMRVHLILPESDNLINDVCDELNIDLRWLPLPFIGPEDRSAPSLFGEGKDFWGVEYVKVQTTSDSYYEFARHPLAEAKSVAEVEAYEWPSLDWWDYSAVGELIERINSRDRRAIMFFAGGAFETPWYLRGMEKFLVDLHTQPEIPAAICQHVEEYYRRRALRVIDAAGGKVDMIGSGGDIGTQRGMMLSPGVWREQIKPFTGRLISTFKNMGLKTFYHSCGSIVPVIDDLIEVGLDLLDPIQVCAAGMNPENLYSRFGKRLSFHGAIDEQELLPNGTPAEVYDETKRTINILAQCGGYVVSAAHQVQADTPPENVVAMLDAARNINIKINSFRHLTPPDTFV